MLANQNSVAILPTYDALASVGLAPMILSWH